jgi:hypothetical protein
MAIRATCDGCFMEYTVADEKAGKAFKCKECGGAVRVPRKGAQPSAPRATSASPPPQRRAAAPAKKSSPKKKRRSTSSGAGAMIPLVLGLLVLLGAGVGGYVLYTSAGGAGGGPGSNELTESSPEIDPLSTDEQAVLDGFRQMIRSLPVGTTTTEQRMAAMQELADKHGMTREDVMAILKKDSQNREAANKVDTSWQPLAISPPAAPAWPKSVQVSISKGINDPTLRVPKVPAPFLLASNSATGGHVRDVFNLSTGQAIGSWPKDSIVSGNEQLSPDGRLVLLQKGSQPPITFHIVDAASGNELQQITSPDILEVRYVTLLPDSRLIVFSPASQERNRRYRVLVFDATTGKETARYEREFHFAGNDQISYSPDGKYFVACGRGKSIEVCEIATGKQVCALDLAAEVTQFAQVISVAFSPDGRQIAVLAEQPGRALRLHMVECANGKIIRKIDLHGSTTTMGGTGELQLQRPLVWFPDGRHVLLANLIVVDTTTGRTIWQAQGKQSPVSTLRYPTAGGVLYQVNGETTTTLETSPIEFARTSAVQQSWPSDALLAPGMSVSIDVDLSGGGLQNLDEVVTTALAGKLEEQGFEVARDAGPVLQVRIEGGLMAFAWIGADGRTLWEMLAANSEIVVIHLGHARDYAADRAARSEGITRLLAWPTPYFIAAGGAWTLPIIAQIDHGG